jgi:uncharacterized membrane-anchored protein YjiN (DUF445 family)
MQAKAKRLALPVDRGTRMRMVATGLLICMAAAFILIRRFGGEHPAWGFALAFTEAAMVGGLADWFAVTALFRHPLGVPIPHTAIIPENKDRIAETMAAFLRDNFLTPTVVARRMKGYNIASAAGGYLADPAEGGRSRIGAGAAGLLADILESLDKDQLGGLVKGALRNQLEKLDVAPLLGQLLTAAIADQRHLPVIESFIRRAALTIEDNEDLVRAIIHERAGGIMRFTGLDEKVANAVLDGLYKLLAETLVMPEHPLRGRIIEGIDQLAHDLLHDPVMQARVQRLKAEVLSNPAMAHWMDGMWEQLRVKMLRAVRDPERVLSGQVGESLGALGTALQGDERLQMMVNRFARRTTVGVVTRYGDEIVRLVSETVRRWDAQTVTDRIEGAVGRDLQFIRINGTLVGGLVGLALHGLGAIL